MKTTHTHKGHCQVCGNLHAVDNSHNGLAKHGYDVSWGFFNGVCSGADNLPIQLDKTLADRTIKSLDKAIAGFQNSIDTINEWFPKAVYGYKLDGKFVALPHVYSNFHTTDRLYEKSISRFTMDKRRYELLIEEGYTSEELTYDEFVIATNDLEYENPTEYLKNWRETRVGVLTHDMGQAEGHKQFLEELIEKYYGKPRIESNLINKVVNELSEIASADIVDEEPRIEIKTDWNGREFKIRKFSVWNSEAEKEINGRMLKIVCKRNNTYKKYTAYTFLDGKKISRKKLDEALF